VSSAIEEETCKLRFAYLVDLESLVARQPDRLLGMRVHTHRADGQTMSSKGCVAATRS
jgi:hypothetical protein